jgi:probable F420-dependent oxidoreductase
MKYGVVFPQLEIGNDPLVIRDYVQGIEGLGFDYLLAYDHVIGANPNRPGGWSGRYNLYDAFHEPLILFSYLAAITQKLEFVTGILILSQRPAVLVAKQAAQLDVLSGGRLRLGVAIGWNKLEYDSLGYDFRNRAKRLEEQVTVMRALWQNESVTFHGEYHHIDNAGINPLPVQRPIPIWFGGGTKDVILRRMAQLADGWIANATSVADGQGIVSRIKHFLAEAGRHPRDFGIDMRLNVRTLPQTEWENYLLGWRDLGATHMGINTMDAGFTNLDQHLKVIEQFKQVADSI